jgi:hypothetical protein
MPLLRAALAPLGLALGLAALRLGAQASVVPITSEPSHHFALENSYVRVFDVTAAPHASTLVHAHDHDYLFVTLGDADITSTRRDVAPTHLVLRDGTVEYAAGGFAHSVTNNLDRPFHNITIEMLRPSTNVRPCGEHCASLRACSPRHGCVTENRPYHADQWTVRTVMVNPGADWGMNAATGPALVVVATDADLALHGPHATTATTHRPAGNLIWVPEVSHEGPTAHASVRNTGSAPARLVVLQLRKAAVSG